MLLTKLGCLCALIHTSLFFLSLSRDLSLDEEFVDELRTNIRFLASVLFRRMKKVCSVLIVASSCSPVGGTLILLIFLSFGVLSMFYKLRDLCSYNCVGGRVGGCIHVYAFVPVCVRVHASFCSCMIAPDKKSKLLLIVKASSQSTVLPFIATIS